MPTAISTGHIETTKVARTILENGGNAFDAAIAALATMFITEPCMSSLGGGGFAFIETAKGERKVLDFFCQTPRKKKVDKEFIPIKVDFGNTQERYYGGNGAIAIPGTPAGMVTLHKAYGTIPIKELFAPALELLREGLRFNNFQHYDLRLLAPLYSLSKKECNHFFTRGELKIKGDHYSIPKLADTLDTVLAEGLENFYTGSIAQTFFRQQAQNGGLNTQEDWVSYRAQFRDPHTFSCKEYTVHTAPLPSFGGLWLQAYLQKLGEQSGSFLSAEHRNNLVNAFEILRPIRKTQNGLEQLFPLLTKNVLWQNSASQGTSHFNIIDQWGNTIALTTTIGCGSGVYIKNTGIYMNNMLGEEGLMPNGVDSWVPNTRLYSSTCPTLAEKTTTNEKIVIGSGGSVRIPFMIAQVIENIFTYGQDVATAIETGRIYDDESTIHIEADFPEKGKTNYWNKKNLFFGGVHAIHIKNGEGAAHGDSRREGHAVIF